MLNNTRTKAATADKMSEGTGRVVKKRSALADITNIKRGLRHLVHSSKPLVPCSGKIYKKKESSTGHNMGSSSNKQPASHREKFDVIVPCNDQAPYSSSIIPETGGDHLSPARSLSSSISLVETMSVCDSLTNPEIEFTDIDDGSIITSVEKDEDNSLYVSDNSDMASDMDVEVVDTNNGDPQFCSSFVFDIYKNLRKSEVKKRPLVDYMQKIQTDINPKMRAILIDWLAEVAEDLSLVPEVLFLTVNYVDRYLSGNVINRNSLQLLGIACMRIAAKYEEIKAPEMHEFCYLTDSTYDKEQALHMESDVLSYLKFEMSAPTTKCFLRHFVHAAEGIPEVLSLKFECLANFLAEISLVEYKMLRYAPSLIAASAIFLAKFIIWPNEMPWDSTLRNYTLYQPSDLCDCVKALHHLCCNAYDSHFPGIKEKYCQYKYKYAANLYCPPSIPRDFFQDPDVNSLRIVEFYNDPSCLPIAISGYRM